MIVRATILSLLALIVFPASGLAGGSVSYEDVRKLLPQDVQNHLEFAFEISEVGDAIRLGRHYGEVGGARMGPYEFPAKSKARGGAECTITIITEGAILDVKGKEVVNPADAVEIKENFDSYEVRFEEHQPTVPGRGGVDPGEPAPPQNLTAAEREDVVNEVRAVYNEVEKTELEFDGGEMQSDDEQSGNVVRGFSKDGSVRKVSFDVAMSDHGGFGVEVFTDRRGRPSFVLWDESYWTFDPNDSNKTIDTVTERRFYFSPQGQLAKALQKSYSGSGEKDLLKKRDAAKNRPFEARPFGVPGFYKALKELVDCKDGRLKPIANELWAAQDRMIGH